MHTFLCSICNSIFQDKRNFVRHVKEHQSIRLYHCLRCGLCFKRKYHLTRHLKIHCDYFT